MSIIGIDERIEKLPNVKQHSTKEWNLGNGERFIFSKFTFEGGPSYELTLVYECIADIYPINRPVNASIVVKGKYKFDECVNMVKSLLGKDFELIDITFHVGNTDVYDTIIMVFNGTAKIGHEFTAPEENGKFIIETITCFIDELEQKAQRLIKQYNFDGDRCVYFKPISCESGIITVQLGFDCVPDDEYKKRKQRITITTAKGKLIAQICDYR